MASITNPHQNIFIPYVVNPSKRQSVTPYGSRDELGPFAKKILNYYQKISHHKEGSNNTHYLLETCLINIGKARHKKGDYRATIVNNFRRSVTLLDSAKKTSHANIRVHLLERAFTHADIASRPRTEGSSNDSISLQPQVLTIGIPEHLSFSSKTKTS